MVTLDADIDEKENLVRKFVYATLFAAVVLVALASYTWRPFVLSGWGVVAEGRIPGWAHDDPTIAATASTHQALNLGIWGDRDLGSSLEYACERLNDAHMHAVAADAPARTSDRIAVVRDDACEDVHDGGIGVVGLHNAVQALEDHLLRGH